MELTQEQQEYVDQLLVQQKQDYESQIESLRLELDSHKPKEQTDEQKEIVKLKAELLQQQVVNMLKESELSDFESLIHAPDYESAKSQIETLKQVINGRKLSNHYQPTDHKQTDAYSVAKSQGNTENMIKALMFQ